MAADDAHHQPRPGAGIAEIKRLARLQQRADTDTIDLPEALAPPFDLRAQRPAGRTAVEHILPLQQAADFRPADLSSPRMKARCEMDLSPGGRSRPFSGPPGAVLKAAAGGETLIETAKIPPRAGEFTALLVACELGEVMGQSAPPPSDFSQCGPHDLLRIDP